MSPMKSSFTPARSVRDRRRESAWPRRSAIFGSTTRSSPSRSVAVARRGVDGAVDADGAGEAAEVALDQVEAGRALRPRLGPVLLAGDDDHAGLDDDAEVGRRDARHVDHQVEGVVGLEDVEQRQALAGDLVAAVGPLAGQLVEQLADVGGDVADVGGRREGVTEGAFGEAGTAIVPRSTRMASAAAPSGQYMSV